MSIITSVITSIINQQLQLHNVHIKHFNNT